MSYNGKLLKVSVSNLLPKGFKYNKDEVDLAIEAAKQRKIVMIFEMDRVEGGCEFDNLIESPIVDEEIAQDDFHFNFNLVGYVDVFTRNEDNNIDAKVLIMHERIIKDMLDGKSYSMFVWDYGMGIEPFKNGKVPAHAYLPHGLRIVKSDDKDNFVGENCSNFELVDKKDCIKLNKGEKSCL